MFFLQSKGGLKMPKREDINTVLVIGSGPIIIVKHVNLIIQVHKLVKH